MALKFPAAFRTTRADTVTTRAGNGAKLRIYDGTRAASADTAVGAQVLLAGSITQDSSANASGTATWFRLVDSAGTTTVMDGSVTATGGGGDLELVTTTIVSPATTGPAAIADPSVVRRVSTLPSSRDSRCT